ncbi:MAG: hypothetical protein U1E73_13080 [Planctomycetota bacterium]
MTEMPAPRASRAALRRLSAPHALAFGSRLLSQGTGGPITFREFLCVAREWIAATPDQAAVYLAALVALDMSTDDSLLAPVPSTPSPN